MIRKLALIALLVLYGLTGSVAAFADDDHCAHRGPAHATLLPAVSDAVDGQPVEKAHACTGLCHLLSVAQLQDDGPALVAPPLTAQQVPATHAVGWTEPTRGVPTPPPNVVSSLL